MAPSQEADILTRYIADTLPDSATQEQYARAVETLHVSLHLDDTAIWEWVLRHPWSLRCIDGGLALVNATHPIRKKIFIAGAILETQPQGANQFLYSRHRMPTMYALAVSIRAGVSGFIGAACIVTLLRKTSLYAGRT